MGKLEKTLIRDLRSPWLTVILAAGLGLALVLLRPAFLRAASDPEPAVKPVVTGVSYTNDRRPEVPWSIHVVTINRTNTGYSLHSTFGNGRSQGLTTLSEQIRGMPAELGRPIAAINGDFWVDSGTYAGDPLGLQIVEGELISGPSDRACIWVDAAGELHSGAVAAAFRVTWPGGKATPINLNCERTNDSAVLYTHAGGNSTRTRGGREIILGRNGEEDWLPLRAGRTYQAKVIEVREDGNSPVSRNTAILSLSPELLAQIPLPKRNEVLTISTLTFPDLSEVNTAMGGGPALVKNGKVGTFTGSQPRHPRSAIGWNKNHLYFVQVDGRQRNLSIGMTLAELADYLAKLGCDEAINFDGGASATCWVYGSVVNSPCAGHERQTANGLVLTFKEKLPD